MTATATTSRPAKAKGQAARTHVRGAVAAPATGTVEPAPARRRGRPRLEDSKRRQAVRVWLSGAEYARVFARRYSATGSEDPSIAEFLRELIFKGLENTASHDDGSLEAEHEREQRR